MEIVRFPSHGGFSVRSIFSFVLAVIISALLLTPLTSSNAHAATDARWGGDAIIYDGRAYTEASGFSDPTNTIPAGAQVYKTPVQQIGTGSNAAKKIFIIYFSPGVDPPTATSAEYVTFDIKGDVISNPKDKKTLSLTIKSEQGETSSCSVDGVGWYVCPISNFLASAMDAIFGFLSDLITTQPLVLGDTSNSMYIAWNIMRSIANIAFVIGFLIIIYSQLTNYGVSNYGLKKLTPRLIIAAVLVNSSFIIAALAIDISNIIGYSIQDVFVNIREGVFNITEDNAGVLTAGSKVWGDVTLAVLGTGGIIGGVWYASSTGLYLLIPILLSLIATAMLVLIILAARQAIIIILVIISPLAFVANLLPNTEKWFTKWKDLFFTMLIFFPAFSLVFGGSQLAGQIIIQNASSQGAVNNIVMVIFGLAVQVAPLVITPLLLKLSGGFLGKVAQIANNPSKGLIDRNRNWAQKRAENARLKNIGQGPRLRNPTSYGAHLTRAADKRRRNLETSTEMWKTAASNRYHSSKGYEKLHEQAEGFEREKAAIDKRNEAHIAEKATITGSRLNIQTVKLEDAKVLAERAEAKQADMLSAYRAGTYINTEDPKHDKRLAAIQQRMANNVIETAAWKQSEQNTQYAQQGNISEKLRTDGSLLDIAQGHGDAATMAVSRDRARANAVATLTKLNKEARDNVITLVQDEAIRSNKTVVGHVNEVFNAAISPDPAKRKPLSTTEMEAVLEIAASEGMVWVFENARRNTEIDQVLVDSVVARHVSDFKAKGGFHIQQSPDLSLQRYIEKARAKAVEAGGSADSINIAAVERQFEQDLSKARLSTLSNTNAANLGGVKYGVFDGLFKDMLAVTENPNNKDELIPSGKPSILDAIQPRADGSYSEKDKDLLMRINEIFTDALNDPSTRATMSDRLKQARSMQEAIRNKLGASQAPLTLSTSERSEPGVDTPADDQN